MIREQRGETNQLSSKKYSTIIQSIESPKRKDASLQDSNQVQNCAAIPNPQTPRRMIVDIVHNMK